LSNLDDVDTSLEETFAGGGWIYTRSSTSIAPALAPADDKLDRNCNGYDF
jgi:hypothetical protein